MQISSSTAPSFRPTSVTASPTFAPFPAPSSSRAKPSQVQAAIRVCAKHNIPFVARGAGTGLSGGALPTPGCVVIGLARMNRVPSIDLDNALITVEPGVTNSQVTELVRSAGFFYAPDPSSQIVCTIGGNLAENAGGAHCLKYGFTTTHVLGCEVVLPSGELVWLGSPHGVPDTPGYDLMGVFIGSEGTLGVATKAVLRIVRRPQCVQTLLAAFDSSSAAGQTVSDIIAAGMLPSAMEMMDRTSIFAAEAAVHAGYPDCECLLLVELDGPIDEVNTQMQRVRELCTKNGAWEQRLAQSDAERALVWKGRKAAFAAMGRVSPNYIVQDGVIPRTALPSHTCAHARACPPKPACASPTSSTPATAISTRWSSTTARTPAKKNARSISPTKSFSSASTPAAPSPANTASAGKSNAS